MTESEIREVIEESVGDWARENGESVDTVRFEDSGVMTMNTGLTLRMDDSEFQVTIIRSR